MINLALVVVFIGAGHYSNSLAYLVWDVKSMVEV